MKLFTKISLLTSHILLLCIATHAQTIRIADNNVIRPTGTNVYSTLQAAIDAAQPDDIVYITPSNTSYGNVTLAKRIALQGVGYNSGLGDRNSTLGTLNLTSSIDGVNSVSGSVLKGFSASAITFTASGIGTPTFDNIVIEKVSTNYINVSSPATKEINNLIIRSVDATEIVFENTAGIKNSKIYNNAIANLRLASSALTNNVIANNIFITSLPYGYSVSINSNGVANNTLLVNNIFSGSASAFALLDGVTCSNNIFYGMNPTCVNTSFYFRNNNFSNNLITSTTTMPPPANGGGTNNGLGNLVGISPNFVSVANTIYSSTYNYALSSGSPAKNAGSDGTDIGITGGLYPVISNFAIYVPSALPLITELNTSGVIPQNQPLKVNLKAKSN
ncbi:MAG: hypothetical protein ACK47E_05180 [Cyclobacteriaceae bacterium]